jgi:hypothetical protein
VERPLSILGADHADACCSYTRLLDHEDAVAIGGDLGESRDELLTVIREIYPPEKEKLSVLAIQIERARDASSPSTETANCIGTSPKELI